MGELSLKQLLEVSESYSGEGISVRMLEETIHTERTRQNRQVSELNVLRTRNGELQGNLSTEIDKLRQISEQLHQQRDQKKGFFASMLERIGLKNEELTTQSIEELLRRQYELSAMRVKEAAEFSDRLDVAKADLYDEIERLNQKIIDYAKNEDTAAANVLHLDSLRGELEMKTST